MNEEEGEGEAGWEGSGGEALTLSRTMEWTLAVRRIGIKTARIERLLSFLPSFLPCFLPAFAEILILMSLLGRFSRSSSTATRATTCRANVLLSPFGIGDLRPPHYAEGEEKGERKEREWSPKDKEEAEGWTERERRKRFMTVLIRESSARPTSCLMTEMLFLVGS